MRNTYSTLTRRLCGIATFFAGVLAAQAGPLLPYFHDDAEMEAFSKECRKPIYIDRDRVVNDEFFSDDELLAGRKVFTVPTTGKDVEFRLLRNRRALVGEKCTVNKLVTEVGVGTWCNNMNNLLDDDLNNFASFNKVVSASVTVDPILTIRDMSRYYASGTKAGFCLVAGSGNSAVLALDVIKAMSIGFYRDGKYLGSSKVEEGQGGEGIKLSLVQIEGSDCSQVLLVATSKWAFDEISLDPSGGVQVGVAKLFQIKYAFVGDAHEYNITTNNPTQTEKDAQGHDITVQKKGLPALNFAREEKGHLGQVAIDYVKGWNPVLLGIPFPWIKNERNKLINNTLDDYGVCTPILAIGYQGGAKFMCKDGNTRNEVFAPGVDVGFRYKFASGLKLGVGGWVRLILFDREGNKVQEETLKGEVLDLTVGAGGDATGTITAQHAFSGAEIRFHTVLSVDVGAIMIYNAFVKDKPDVEHHCDIRPSYNISVCEDEHGCQLTSNPDIPVTWAIAKEPQRDASGNVIEGAPWIDMIPADAAILADDERVVVSSGGKVSKLFVPGEYTFVATAADGICTDTCVVRYNMFGDQSTFLDGVLNQEGCERPLLNGINNGVYKLTDDLHGEISGSLISISDMDHPENVLNGSWDNYANSYASYKAGLNVTSNMCIIGVVRLPDPGSQSDPTIYDSHTETPKRIGFIVEPNISVLDVSALQFIQIRCCYKGKEVYRDVIAENNAVKAKIGAASEVQKLRYSIVLPTYDKDGNKFKVDEFQLWTSGVLNIGGSNLRIYYAFIEEAESDCANMLGCGSELLSWDKTHTRLNGDATKYVDVISVGRTIDNISFMLDDDPNTAMTLNNPVNAGGVTLSFFVGRTVKPGTQLGIIAENKTYLLSADVGNWLKAQTYYRGVATGDELTDWSVVGANVAGSGDKSFLLVRSTMPYDEVRITFGSVLSALNVDQKYFGLFLRTDTDGDGVPDCRGGCPCAPALSVGATCLGDEVLIPQRGGLKAGHSYTFTTNEPGVAPVSGVVPDDDGLLQHHHTATTVGEEFTMTITDDQDGDKDQDGNIIRDPATGEIVKHTVIATRTYSVRPNWTAWRKDATSNNWNRWDNWTNGIPSCCTDVIIPSDAANYPALADSINPDPKDEDLSAMYYCCNNIFIQPRGRVDNTTALNYKRAWVEWEQPANKTDYYLFSAPLKNMYTGDMFIRATDRGQQTGLPFTKDPNSSEQENARDSITKTFFMELTATTCPQSRFNPSVYQRMWDSTVKWAHVRKTDETGAPVTYDDLNADATQWTSVTNILNKKFERGVASSVWIDNGKLSADQKFRFRFPKMHTSYDYFDAYDQTSTFGSEEIGRKDDPTMRVDYQTADMAPHRFIYEDYSPEGETRVVEKTYRRNIIDPAAPTQIKADADERIVFNQHKSFTIKLSTSTSDPNGTQSFLLGNPFMGNIYLDRFLEDNADITTRDANNQPVANGIESVQFVRSDQYAVICADGHGNLLTTAQKGYADHVAPMEGVYVKAKVATKTLPVTITTDMLKPRDIVEKPADINPQTNSGNSGNSGTPAGAPAKTRVADTEAPAYAPQILISMRHGDYNTAALIVDSVYGAVHSAALFDSEVAPKNAIFGLCATANKEAAADGTLTACNILPLADDVPLGIIAADTATVTIAFHTDNLFPRDEYYVYDRETGTRYWLDDDIVLRNAGTSLGRYILHRGDIYDENDLQTGIEDATTAATTGTADDGISVSVRESRATVRSQSADIASLAVYTAAGQLVRTEQATGRRADIGLTQGMQILRVRLADGRQHSYKIGR